MNESCPSSWPTEARVCPCFCHMQLNNIGGCNHCNCKPVFGNQAMIGDSYYSLLEKIKFLEQSLGNALKRINNIACDVKELIIRMNNLDQQKNPTSSLPS